MDLRRSVSFLLAIAFLAISLFIIFYLFDGGFYTNSDLFWIGGLAGVFGCIFFVATIGVIFALAKHSATMKNWLVGLIILSIVGLSIIYFVRGPFSLNSDTWWYGVITGFFSCLATILLSLSSLIFYKSFKKTKSKIQKA